ncbi:MAG: type III-A CRISPR-associated protein Csm2 [Candidatus Obscuribacterales bacterium]|nr:type III-A CRISPR-associated protein Csm2 [Candidatus Obscuribacterales bacterium]
MSNEQQKADGGSGEQEGGGAESPNRAAQQNDSERPVSGQQQVGGERHGGGERSSGSSGRPGGGRQGSGGRQGGNREGGGNRDGSGRMRPKGPGQQQPQRSQQRPQAPRPALVSGKLVELFRAGEESTQDLVQLAHDFASQTGHVKHHQLRNLLDLVIWAKQSHHEGKDSILAAPVKGRLACLRPRVAYMAARERGLLSLRDELDLLLKDKEAFTRGADLDRLYTFVAAVVAYHKFEEVTREHQRSK